MINIDLTTLILLVLAGKHALADNDDYEIDLEIAANDDSAGTLSDEKRLTRHLLKTYEMAGVLGRPVYNTSSVLVVQFGISLIQIIDLDEKGQVLTLNVWNNYKWVDSLLKWNPKNFGNLDKIRIPSHNIWTPDIVLYNYADERLKEQREALATVSFDGNVSWLPTAIYKSTCKINIENFPFDVQTCQLKFGSWTFDGGKLDIRQLNDWDGLDLDTYTRSKEWEIVSSPCERNQTTRGNTAYPNLVYTLTIRRTAVTYVFLLIIPCILLSVLNLVIFWLPPEAPAKMMLGVMIFAAFFVLLQLLASLTPPTANPPKIGIYFCVNMIMITVSTFIAVSILYLYFRGDRKNQVPEFVRKVMLEGMVKVLCMQNMLEKTGKPPPAEKQLASLPLIRRTSNKDKMVATMGNKAILDLRPLAAEVARQYQTTPDKSPMHNRNLEGDVKEVKRLIRNYVNRLTEKENVARAAKEWRNLSRVVDRLFFFIYLSVIVVSLATIFPKRET